MTTMTVPEGPPASIAPHVDGFETLAPEDIANAFLQAMNVSVTQVAKMAAAVWVIDRRGPEATATFERLIAEQNPRIRRSTFTSLRRIAYGQMLPELLTTFGGQATRLGNLPMPEQRRIVENAPFELVQLEDQGPTHVKRRLTEATAEEIQQLVASDHIRDRAEQIAWLQSRRARERESRIVRSQPPVVINKRKRCIQVNAPCTLSVSELLHYIQALQK